MDIFEAVERGRRSKPHATRVRVSPDVSERARQILSGAWFQPVGIRFDSYDGLEWFCDPTLPDGSVEVE